MVFSSYTSILFHTALILGAYWLPLSYNPEDKPICGIDWPVLSEEEPENLLSLSFEFAKEPNQIKNNPQEEGVAVPGQPEGQKKIKKQPEAKKDAERKAAKQLVQQKLKQKYGKGEWKQLVKNLEKAEQIGTLKREFDNIIRGGVSDKYIYRKRHYQDMVVKDVLPTLNDIDKNFTDQLKKSAKNLEKHNQRNQIIEEFRLGEDGDEYLSIERSEISEETEQLPPLAMDAKARQEYFDSTLPLAKEEQLGKFMNKFLAYDPDKGDLPMMFRDLYYQNLQRLAYGFSPDPSYFTIDYFEENLNKEDYLKNAMYMVSELQGTKTATEILFTLENIYEIQQRAIFQYLENRQRLKNYKGPGKKRLEVIKGVIRKYESMIQQKNIKTHADAVDLYAKRRLEIMDFLLKTSPEGYRQKDALFEKGKILWEKSSFKPAEQQKLLQEAIRVWEDLARIDRRTDKNFLNQKAFAELKGLIKAYKNAPPHKKNSTKQKMSQVIQNRFAPILREKHLREERLLWPKKIKK